MKVCPGCGEPLPPYSGKGRPPAYHNPACRQRAYRRRKRERLKAAQGPSRPGQVAGE
ncbi:MAG: hypothetical protein L0346_34385 [Chloroflexi bacterium]|nr:hypothetical protein [Chloroflexota bacterium]